MNYKKKALEKNQYYIHSLRNLISNSSLPSLTQISSFYNLFPLIANLDPNDTNLTEKVNSIVEIITRNDFSFHSFFKPSEIIFPNKCSFYEFLLDNSKLVYSHELQRTSFYFLDENDKRFFSLRSDIISSSRKEKNYFTNNFLLEPLFYFFYTLNKFINNSKEINKNDSFCEISKFFSGSYDVNTTTYNIKKEECKILLKEWQRLILLDYFQFEIPSRLEDSFENIYILEKLRNNFSFRMVLVMVKDILIGALSNKSEGEDLSMKNFFLVDDRIEQCFGEKITKIFGLSERKRITISSGEKNTFETYFNGEKDFSRFFDRIIQEHKIKSASDKTQYQVNFENIPINDDLFLFNPNFLLYKMLLEERKSFNLKFRNLFSLDLDFKKLVFISLIIFFSSYLVEYVFSRMSFFNSIYGVNNLDIFIEKSITKPILNIDINILQKILTKCYSDYKLGDYKRSNFTSGLNKITYLNGSMFKTNVANYLEICFRSLFPIVHEENFLGSEEKAYNLNKRFLEFDNVIPETFNNFLSSYKNDFNDLILGQIFGKFDIFSVNKLDTKGRMLKILKSKSINQILGLLFGFSSLCLRSIFILPKEKVPAVTISKDKKKITSGLFIRLKRMLAKQIYDFILSTLIILSFISLAGDNLSPGDLFFIFSLLSFYFFVSKVYFEIEVIKPVI